MIKRIDTHLHLWDPKRIAYSWQAGHALLNRSYEVEDYQQASQEIDVEAMVFVESTDASLRRYRR